MKHARTVFAMALLVVFILATPILAEVPTTMNYQGRLTDAGGSPVVDNTYTVEFRIYDETSTQRWMETHDVTTVAGLFSVELGSNGSPLGESVFDYAECWLGITVGTDPELTPRTRFASVAYAFECGSADWVLADSVLYTDNYWGIARGGADNALYGETMYDGNFAHTMVNLGVACTTGTSTYGGICNTVSGGANNVASSIYSTVGGGRHNKATDDYSTIAGGLENVAGGNRSMVGGGFGNKAPDAYCTVGGGSYNIAGSDDGDGGSTQDATVGGGGGNHASGWESTVGGGDRNEASGNEAFVGGGGENTASGSDATVAGGKYNLASGDYSTVAGGRFNAARERDAFAAGSRAKASHRGAVVISASFSNNSVDSVASSGDEQMVLRADGGLYITNTSELAPYDNSNLITTRGGAYLSGTGTNWTNSSDRNKKENFKPVNGQEILELLEQLDISQWNYKEDSDSVTHIGPVAQDFYGVFGYGNDETSISTIDPAGIALVAIQALHEKTKEIDELKEEIDELNAVVEKLVGESAKR